MHIELNHDEATALRELLQERVVELDKEISATESLKFKEGLREIARTNERILGAVTRALEASAGAERPAG